jgi:hypothetical protein
MKEEVVDRTSKEEAIAIGIDSISQRCCRFISNCAMWGLGENFFVKSAVE